MNAFLLASLLAAPELGPQPEPQGPAINGPESTSYGAGYGAGSADEADDLVLQADGGEEEGSEFGPFFEGEPPSDTAFPSEARSLDKPLLSVGNGAFCFVEDSRCKASMILSASVAAGIRVPAGDAGPQIPFAQFTFRGGLVVRPKMLVRQSWHAWGVGLVGSWSQGTGSVTNLASDSLDTRQTEKTTTVRVAALNQLWLSKKSNALHFDVSLGGARSEILTTGVERWGPHAEVGLGWGGWGGVYASSDFLEDDTRVVFGFRGHGIAAGPIVAMVLAGLALGGAL